MEASDVSHAFIELSISSKNVFEYLQIQKIYTVCFQMLVTFVRLLLDEMSVYAFDCGTVKNIVNVVGRYHTDF